MKRRVLAWIMTFMIVFGTMPNNIWNASAATTGSEEPIATLFFASDYQSYSGTEESTFTALLNSVNNAGRGDDIDTAVFCVITGKP